MTPAALAEDFEALPDYTADDDGIHISVGIDGKSVDAQTTLIIGPSPRLS